MPKKSQINEYSDVTLSTYIVVCYNFVVYQWFFVCREEVCELRYVICERDLVEK